MKKFLYSVIVLLSISSCSNNEHTVNEGSSNVRLDIVTDPSYATKSRQTRAGGSTDIARYENSDNYSVKIFSDTKIAYNGLAKDMPLEMEMDLGSYQMQAWLSTDVNAAFDSLYVYGENQFEVTAGISTEAQVSCIPANVRVNVSYDKTLDSYYSDYRISFATSNQTTPIDFAVADSTKDLYFKANKQDDKMLISLQMKNLDGAEIPKIELSQPIRPREFLNIKVTPKLIDVEGGVLAGITININDQTIDKDTTILIPGDMLPKIVQ